MSGESEEVTITAVEGTGAGSNCLKMNSAKKQARLSFKLLDPNTAPPASKKRKLSDDEPTCKTTRTSGSKLIDKKVTPVKGSNKVLIVDENEVSSSSEPEAIQAEKKTARAGLMKFFSPATQLKEVSTSVPSEGENNTRLNQDAKSLGQSPNVSNDPKNVCNETDEKPVVTDDVTDDVTETSLEVEETESDKKSENNDLEISMSGSDDSVMEISEADDSLIESSHSGECEAGDMKRTISETSLSQDEEGKARKTGNEDTPQSQKSNKSVKMGKKQLEKQQERAEKQKQKEEARLEKEKKKQEEKDKKQAEKDKKEREKLEKKEALEKEKLEKQKVKDEEKKKKLEALEAERVKKEEDKKKKEADRAKKEEEKKMKEEEKVKKDEEKKKEEEEQQKKKASQKAAFMSFFKKTEKQDEALPVGNARRSGKFMAFMLKKDMVLAPARRSKLETDGFDESYHEQNIAQRLYLDELKSENVKPRRCAKTIESKDRDLIVLDEDAPDFYKAKFLKFHKNHRPPYYGTWRKTSKVLSAKNPFKKDESLFDYEVDSDDEWEEEEPGESLSNSEGEDENENENETGENADEEEDEDGFFVPHGYLSDGEGCEEDDDVNPEKMKAKQQARQHAFEVDLKKQCQKLIPIVIGLCWQYSETPHSSTEKALRDYECVPLTATPIVSTLSARPEPMDDHKEAKDERKTRRFAVPEEAMPDLIRLFHGNFHPLKKLLNEFRTYWRQKSLNKSDESRSSLDKSQGSENENEDVKSQTTPTAATSSPSRLGQISKRQLEMKIQAIAEYKKCSSRGCWYVKDQVLKQYGLESLPVPTEWTYVTEVDEGGRNTTKDGGRNTPTSGTKSGGRNTPTSGTRSLGIRQFAVKTTSDDLFTSPSAASPKQRLVKRSPLTTSPKTTLATASPTSPQTSKPARRVQLTSLGIFRTKSSLSFANSNNICLKSKPTEPQSSVVPIQVVSTLSETLNGPSVLLTTPATASPLQPSNSMGVSAKIDDEIIILD